MSMIFSEGRITYQLPPRCYRSIATFTPIEYGRHSNAAVLSTIFVLEQKWPLSGVQLEEFKQAASLKFDRLKIAERDLETAFAGTLEACQAIAAWENGIPTDRVGLSKILTQGNRGSGQHHVAHTIERRSIKRFHANSCLEGR